MMKEKRRNKEKIIDGEDKEDYIQDDSKEVEGSTIKGKSMKKLMKGN